MAPKRKNRKPAANPTRGFATTSTASKAKPPVDVEFEVSTLDNTPPNNDLPKEYLGGDHPVERELHELNPEELEEKLEESDLNLFLERHSEKIKRDVARQINKLQTERRLIRAQAVPLQTSAWLPPEIMKLIMETVKAEKHEDSRLFHLQNVLSDDELSEDDSCVKIWTLKQVLVQLGFEYKLCQGALEHLLSAVQDSTSRQNLACKDSIWGLDHCFEWLALHCDPKEAPSYASSFTEIDVRPFLGQQQYTDAKSTPSINEPTTKSPTASGSLSPSSHTTADGDGVAPYVEPASTPPSSDTDSDMDPDTMTERYVELQTRLYKLDQEADITKHQTQSNPRKQSPNTPPKDLQPQLVKILRKLDRLKSDILFDKFDAEQKWTEKRNYMAKATAQRKKLQLIESEPSKTTLMGKYADDNLTSHLEPEKSDNFQEDGGAEALGEFFSGLPDNNLVDDRGLSSLDVQAPFQQHRRVRNLGRWNGISPRRILEDACKARDASVRIDYELLDRSPFVKQHIVHIHWSCDQPQILESPTESISGTANRRHVRVEMVQEASPDVAQSEAYISTAALYLVFSSIPKEEKASLRLPSAWKSLWVELSELKKERDMVADRDELRRIRALIEARPKNSDGSLQEPCDRPSKSPNLVLGTRSEEIGSTQRLELSEPLKALWSSKSTAPSYHKMLRQRKNLPIWASKDIILQMIGNNPIVIVCGETGCGKSTQVPSFILERELSVGKPCRIYCTEPRRISAITLARRVCDELGEVKNDIGTSRSLVGYAIRMENRVAQGTRLVYATTGVVMRMLESSDDLRDITHLVLDEVHERSIESDFLLIVLRKLLVKRPDLRVILMSATVDATKFSDYFHGAPIITVPGRTFPVETRYLEDALEETQFTTHGSQHETSIDDDEDDNDRNAEQGMKDRHETLTGYSSKTRNTLASLDEYRVNYDLIVSLLETVATRQKFASFSKAILVFLPGIAEIRRLHNILNSHSTFIHGWQINALHSSIAMDEQERAFMTMPGYRKIVLATNIAETGVTISDVTCVIDTGKHKEMRFDERRQLSRLIEVFISRANAKQRRGRAGRVQKGLCFHLFTKARHDTTMAQEQTPEMLRLSLQDLVLRVKICRLGSVEQSLSEALDPPLAKNIRRAIDALVDVKALTSTEELTSLGRQLAKLPLDVFLGKLILLGSIFHCLDGALTIAAILSSKSPFSAPMGAKSQADQARLAFRKGDSDLLMLYNAYCSWRRACNAGGSAEQQFCRKNSLSQQNLRSIEELKAQLAISLIDADFLTLEEGEEVSLNKSWSTKRTFVDVPARYNINSTDLILNSIVCWSFYPKLLKRDGKGWRNVANNQSVSLHPTSVNKGIEHPPNWLSFYHIMQSSNKFYNAHETSAAEPFALILTCGDAEFKMYSGVIVVDGNRIRLSLNDWKQMLAIKTLRHKLRQITTQLYRDPGYRLTVQQETWLDIWQKIFAYNDEKSAKVKK